MTVETRRTKLEAWAELIREYKRSGMKQADFARSKGIGKDAFLYRLSVLRKEAPELLHDPEDSHLVPIPPEYMTPEADSETEGYDVQEGPVMMVQSGRISLQVTNQIKPDLLKVAMEVMKSC